MTKGERIKYLRESARMTQDELAKALSTTKQTIYKYENNIVTNIPSDRIELLSSALHTTPAYIMGWTDEPSTDPEPDTPMSGSAEDQLISIYRNLNDEGQEKLVDYANDLAASGRYKKHGSVQMDEIKGA